MAQPSTAWQERVALDDVMRARRVVYFESQKGRGAVPG